MDCKRGPSIGARNKNADAQRTGKEKERKREREKERKREREKERKREREKERKREREKERKRERELCRPGTSSWIPLQKTLWSGSWQRPRMMTTTCPCRTRRPNLRSSTCRWLWHPRLRSPTWSGASHSAWRIPSGVRRWTVCPAWLPRHVSVLLCVLPGFPHTTKKFFLGGRGDGLKWCPRKVISAQCFTHCLVATRDVSSLHHFFVVR